MRIAAYPSRGTQVSVNSDMRARADGSALDWSDTDRRAVDLSRVLAMDAVEQAGSGHPGTAMSLAPAAYLLFQKVMRHDPADPAWLGRDRFVSSRGNSSLTLYIQLYLAGYGVTLDDLRRYRSWGSITPGHPEHGLTPGVETTTGPLGQGIANAVGMAMAARRERGLLDPDASPGASPFDHHVFAIMSDGDIEEGISHEASSLAGHQQLGNLVVIYDDNTISIEDDTNIAKSEDVCARYAAYGWHVQKVSFRTPDGSGDTPGGYHEDVQALYDALLRARTDAGTPSLISLRTIIGWPAPTKQNTGSAHGSAHGSALGAAEVAATKEILGFDPHVSFPAEEHVVAHARAVGERVTYVWTHDSIGLGEDGPTHQPVEHLWASRAIPGLDVVRPGDANETAVAWRTILERPSRPAGLCLTRQELPVLDRSADGPGLGSAEGAGRGGYVLAEADGGPPRGYPDRDWQRGADRARRRGNAARQRHPGQGRVHALPGLVCGAGRRIPRAGAARGHTREGQHRGRHYAGLA
jgi:transketolase